MLKIKLQVKIRVLQWKPKSINQSRANWLTQIKFRNYSLTLTIISSEDVSLPCEDELVKMYAAGGLVNSSVEDLSDLDKVAKIQPGNNGMAVPSKAVPELAEEKAGKSTLETEHDRKNKPSNEAKTPRRNGGPHSDSFVSPSKRNNVFAMRSEERNGSDKKRFSLDGCPGTPKTENKCRWVDVTFPARYFVLFIVLRVISYN